MWENVQTYNSLSISKFFFKQGENQKAAERETQWPFPFCPTGAYNPPLHGLVKVRNFPLFRQGFFVLIPDYVKFISPS